MEKFGTGAALVVGGGVGGLAAAVGLRRAGWRVTVLERARRVDPLGAGITLWPNAVHALRALGLGEQVAALPATTASGGIRTPDGALLTETDATVFEARFGAPMVALHRARLHELLLGALPASAVRTGSPVTAVDQGRAGVTARLDDGTVLTADLLVGADGLRSSVRQHVVGDGPPRYSGSTAWRAVLPAELVPEVPGADGELPLGEMWGPGAVFGVVPLAGGDLYWFATKTAPEGQQDNTGEERKAEVLARFAGWHPAVTRLVAATPPGAVLRHDLFDRRPRRGWSTGAVTLLGDAAHPMTPHLGQGACQALEDAVALVEALRAHPTVPAALAAYEDRRYRRTAPLVTRSRQVGAVATLRNPLLRHLRDAALRRTTPAQQLRRLEAVLVPRPRSEPATARG